VTSAAEQAAEIAQDIKNLIAGMTIAKRELASGSLIDFKSIEDEIAKICQRSEALPREFSSRLLPAMVELSEEFDMLISLLKHLQDAEQQAEAELSRRRAQEAYGKSGQS
jgi:hypothetical protein